MQLYSYSVSIRIRHPTIDPDEISNVLGVEPNRVATSGQPRRTPRSNPLGGVYRESYWSADPFGIREYESVDDTAEDTLTDVIALLERHAEFLARLRAEGGDIRIWISSFGDRNYAFEFTPELLGRCWALGAGLIVDVYGVPQRR